MTRAFLWRLTTTLVLAAGGLRGQDADAPPNRLWRLMDNLDQTHLIVSMDRATPYFPGEAGTITVTLTNSTASALEVPDPRAPGVSAFSLSTQGGAGTKSESEWSAFEPPNTLRDQDVPSTLIQPGQSITVTFPPAECLWPHPTFRMLPTNPGNYRLRFRLGGEVDFAVGSPVLEASTVVPLQDFETYQEEGMDKPKTLQYAAMLIAVRLGDEHVILVGRDKMPTTYTMRTNKDGTLADGEARTEAPWVRLATARSEVTALRGAADPTGRITVDYTTEGGGGNRVYLDKNRQPL